MRQQTPSVAILKMLDARRVFPLMQGGFMNLLGLGNLLFQLGDYAVKAVIHFANTDEGEKEWGDVVAAFVALDLFNPSDAEQGVAVGTPEEASTPITLADLERWTTPSLEHSRGAREAKPARVIHPVQKQSPSDEEIPF